MFLTFHVKKRERLKRMQAVNNRHGVNFGRRFVNAKEAADYTRNIHGGLDALGKELTYILHNSCAPSVAHQNTGIGSLVSETSEKKLHPFLQQHCFKYVLTDPDGLRKFGDSSPYVGDTFAKNILMIPMEKLQKKEKYGGILSSETFEKIVKNRPNKKSNRVDYKYVIPEYEKALREAYDTFKNKSSKVNTLEAGEARGINKLVEDFNGFKQKKGDLLKPNAIYSILSNIHGNDYWPNWKGKFAKLDQVILCPPKNKSVAAKARLAQINKKYADDMDFFMFKQMLISKGRKESPIKTMADSQVAFSDVDVWANQKLFLKGYYLGCPPDYFSANGQAWGFAVLDPKHLFKKDGSLGEGGKLLYNKYKTMFEDNPGGVRIDHIIGLADPFVYTSSPLSKDAGRLYSSPDKSNLAKYAKKTTEEFAQIMEKIVIPAAEGAGVKAENIISEDLGDVTKPTKAVMERLNLRGLAVTQFKEPKEDHVYRGKNVRESYFIMKGSHDNPPDVMHVKRLFKHNIEKVAGLAKLLAEDLLPSSATVRQKKIFRTKLVNSQEKFRAAEWAELFTSPAKSVQIFFEDFLGGTKTYNRPGTVGPHNWSIRMPSDFERQYHQNLQKGRGLNLPEAIATAMKQRGDAFVEEHKKLYNSLRKFAKILKEPEKKN